MINIIIADDHTIFREGIVSILEDEADIKVLAQAVNGIELLQQLEEQSPDLILMDISMKELNGIEASIEIKKKYPAIKILILSMHNEIDYILKVIEVGVDGYILKESGSQELLQAIRSIMIGKNYQSQEISSIIVQHLQKKQDQKLKKAGIPLTRREKEVLQLIAEEYTNPEIAEKLFISIRTVDTHRRNLIEKLGVKNTAGLVKYAIKSGLID